MHLHEVLDEFVVLHAFYGAAPAVLVILEHQKPCLPALRAPSHRYAVAGKAEQRSRALKAQATLLELFGGHCYTVAWQVLSASKMNSGTGSTR
jgi:hypothetical protein